MVAALPTDYYLDNFTTVLDLVEELYTDLLDQPERDFSRSFRACSRDGRRLYVRLVSRKGPSFRADKLRYEEIAAPAEAAAELSATGLLAINDGDAASWLPLLARAEILALIDRHRHRFMDMGARATYRKEALLKLVAARMDGQALHREITALTPIFTPRQTDILRIYRLLFFGNLRQDLTEFVLQDLGLLRYENYPIAREDRLFSTRELVLRTITYAGLAELTYAAVEAGETAHFDDICEAMPDTLNEASLIARRGKILNLMARQLERVGETERALALYAGTYRPPARERRVRILERTGRYTEALVVAREMEAEPQDISETAFTRRFIPKLEKKLGRPALVPKRITHPRDELCLARDEGKAIEQTVLDHYSSLGRQGFYAENWFWQSLFGLAFWDVIFAPVRGAFFNRFQRGPAGLFSPRFYEERQEAIDEVLAALRQGTDWPGRVLETFTGKQGIANYLVHWRYLSRDHLETVLGLVAPTHLAAIFAHFSRDPGAWRNGFPDLFLAGGREGYELVEVKGPGDQLQNNQRRWLRFFKDNGIPYRIARVAWRASDDDRQKPKGSFGV